MPKLPEQKKSSILEVTQKSSFNRGELSIPKIPKYRKVFKHHLKIAGLLLLACVVLTGIFLFAKPIIMKQGDVDLPPPPTELDSFKTPSEDDAQKLNLSNNFIFYIDRINAENKLLYGKTPDGVELVLRVLPTTKIQVLPNDNKPVLLATDSADARNFEDLKIGERTSVITVENPKEGTYLNVVAILIG